MPEYIPLSIKLKRDPIVLQKKILEKEIGNIILESEDGLIPKEKYPEYEAKMQLLLDELNKLFKDNPWLIYVKDYDPEL